jgi:serine/threonine-protein kinase
MPAPQTAEEFLGVIRRSGLFSREECAALPWRYDLREKTTAVEVAQSLLDQKVLTKYQAKRLLQGGGRGLRLNDYRVLDLLGVGGMGWVYLAEEVGTGWKVAVKVLAEKHRRDWGMLSRFQLEAQAGVKLTHPNIIRTKGIFTTEDIYGQIHYIVTEFIQGITLFELIALKRPIPWRQACDIIRQAALGLHYAHQLGMIHRDVKPENILVRSDGTVKVLDFGLAMINKSDEEFAMAMIHGQNCLGTADYVAPEQSIDSFKVDARADVYSLGCAFYFALTGQVPFPIEGKSKAESTSMKLKCHRQVKPKAVAKMRPEVPERVSLIVERMMAKRPQNRIATAMHVAQLLEPWARREPIDFDFAYVLRHRQKEAERRRTVLQAARTTARAANTEGASGSGSSADVSASDNPIVSSSSGGPLSNASSVARALVPESTLRDSRLPSPGAGSSGIGAGSSAVMGALRPDSFSAELAPSLSPEPVLHGPTAGKDAKPVAGGSERSGGSLASAKSDVKTRASLAASPAAPAPPVAKETSLGDDTGFEKRRK